MNSNDKADAAWDDYVSQQQEEKIEELQRELNAANDRIKRLEDARTVASANSLANMLAYEDAVAKIKRLEKAGDYLEYDLKEIWSETRSMREWTKAKEDNP